MVFNEGQRVPRAEVLRGDEMRTPDEVAAMLRLKALGWGTSGLRGSSDAAARRCGATWPRAADVRYRVRPAGLVH